ncbi:MAG: bifunctional [glutamine synthetase] adenylyltransferase/[glutamine synthetase]-adenylyl-L-tyrosine phosphorylase, partial [Pseudomonadota bacterium]
LRPHLPGHPLALSTEDAEIYYERHGQNWERAAWIKARAVAADIEAGRRFLARLQPFIWRKHLDYAAIRDIHSIKRQINAFRGFHEAKIWGHDLKVGRGGIREIEFFAQTQQLILGGQHPELRTSGTVETLERMAETRWVDVDAAQELIAAYRYLRCLEHRLQMQQDRQTQRMPEAGTDGDRFAAFAGYAKPTDLEADLNAVMAAVGEHYGALFEGEADLGIGGNLVFTGTETGPKTLATLEGLGFRQAEKVAERIRSWHHGHIRATRSTRARELLTELVPSILEALKRQPDIDEAFVLFDEFISGLPTGVQLFSLIRAHPDLLRNLTDLFGAMPRLARYLSKNTDLFEAMLSPDFFDPLPSRSELEAELMARVNVARDLQDILDAARRWAHGRQFQAGLHVVLGTSSADQATAMLTDLAEIILNCMMREARRWLEAEHGTIEGAGFAILGLGKLGSRELTIGSDLDLVFVFDAPDEAKSNGAKPLPAQTYFARLGQRLITTISAQTSEGRLFEIDTRLRPSGNVGPVACSVTNFESYNRETAQTWEIQALSRSRVVAGDSELAARVEQVVDEAIRRPREKVPLGHDVRAMRERIFNEHGTASPWNIKHARGGLTELEFLAQYLQLAHAHDIEDLRHPATRSVLQAAGWRELLDAAECGGLVRALRLQTALQLVLRLSGMTNLDEASAAEGLKTTLVRAVARQLGDDVLVPNFAALQRLLVESQAHVRHIFERECTADAGENLE